MLDNQVTSLPAPLQPDVSRWLAEFQRRHGSDVLSGNFGQEVLKVSAASEFCAGVFLRDWKELDFAEPFDTASFKAAVSEQVAGNPERELRRLRRRAHCHLVFDELTGRASTEQTLVCLSEVAECLIDSALGVARERVAERFGELVDSSGKPIPVLVIGMGKLGGRELNFSSDVDLIFACMREGSSDGRRALTALEYAARVVQRLVPLLDDMTEDGFVFRVDARLRPFGDSGPLVCNGAALESYLLNHARVWERYAWVKARCIGRAAESDDADELFDELIRPFVYRQYLDYGLLDELRELHRRIRAEHEGREQDIKLGPGGIREIEFIVQSLQLLRGGVRTELTTRSLLAALAHLRGTQELPEDTADRLRDSYLFLRRLENFIQARRDRQVHALPADDKDRAALALAMGFDDWPTLNSGIETVREFVSGLFSAFAYRAQEADTTAALLFERGGTVEEWATAIEAEGVADATAVAEKLKRFREACDERRITNDAMERLTVLIPLLVSELSTIADPARALKRIIKILEKVLRRSAYVALLYENRDSLRRLVTLAAKSQYIADQVALYPALLDELLDPRLSSKEFSRDRFLKLLRKDVSTIDAEDDEAHTECLARFQRQNLFRIAVADASDDLPLMKVSDSLTWLAESVLDVALQQAWADVSERFGAPCYTIDGERRDARFCIVAYGKLGGLELSYGSDLDLVFLHDSRGESQLTNGERSVDNGLFFARLVRRLLHILTTRTSSGVLYEIDTRLRPSGRSGLLVSGIDAFERYQQQDAWTWEHQSLLRSRSVSGDAGLMDAFEQLRKKALANFVSADKLLDDVVSMRAKMKKELDRSTSERFDLKQGDGGIVDLEFIVQYLCLREAARHPEVIVYSDNIRQIEALAASGVLTADVAERLTTIYQAYRHVLHRRVLDSRKRLVPSSLFVEERRDVRELWDSLLR